MSASAVVDSHARALGFGPLTLCLEGPLCDVAWPMGALQVESVRSDGVRVTTDVVASLPPVRVALVDGRVWRSELTGDGMRFAVVADACGTVIADLTLLAPRHWHLRVVGDVDHGPAPAWSSVLLQLGVAEAAPEYHGLALHAACVQMSDMAVLLCGPSGVGKSTLAARLVRAGATPMSHDRTLVFANETWCAVSTPWGHDGTLAGRLRERPIGAILFLQQASECVSDRVKGAKAVSRIVGSLLGARSAKAAMMRAMSVAVQLSSEVRCYVTRLTNDERATRHVVELVG